LKRKINVLEIVRQRVPGCGTGVGKRLSPARGQIDMGDDDQLSISDGDQERWTIHYSRLKQKSLPRTRCSLCGGGSGTLAVDW